MKPSQKKINKLFLTAIENGELETVKYLLNESPVKADLYVTNEVEDPLYCLLVATSENQLEIIKYLLEETELKKYTKLKGRKDFYDADIGDTISMMYENVGYTGNIELFEYLNKNLYWESKIKLLSGASYNNHIPLMNHIIKNDYLADSDKSVLNNIRNSVMEMAISNNSKEAIQYLLKYYKEQKINPLKNQEFLIDSLLKRISKINKDSTDFEYFDFFYQQPEIQKHQDILLTKKIFQKIAERKNLELYKNAIDKIKDKELKKKIVLDSYYYAVEDYGRLEEYSLFKYLIETYKSYFNKEEKEKVFYGLIYAKDRERFHDLMEYDFLTKGVNPNNILKEAIRQVMVEDAFEYVIQILESKFNQKIKISFENNYFFKMMNEELESDKILELLKVVLGIYPETKIEKITPIFEEKEEVKNFLSKWTLNHKLMTKLPEKNTTIKKIKI